MMRGRIAAWAIVIGVGAQVYTSAQQPEPPSPPPTPPFDAAQGAPSASRGARAAAPIDLTGTWVSIVTEDWRWRMVTPPKGDFPGIPLNAPGRAVANAWNPETDGSCRAFGAAALLRMPTRVRIAWADDTTLKLETDNGQQTRLLRFAARPGRTAPSLQGFSVAEWQRSHGTSNAMGIQFGPPRPGPGGSLKVVTTNLNGGWLRRNGVPYSDRATVTEYFDRMPGPDGSEWFTVTTVVTDPEYLATRFVTSSNFRREPDDSRWTPRPCKAI